MERKNRFVAEVELNGERVGVHVPNTGRCKELFVPGAKVYVQPAENLARKYAYTLRAVYKGDQLVHIDSAGANRLVEEALLSGAVKGLEDVTDVEREKTYGSSRFDFRFRKGGKICYMEVKGVTLEENGTAMFPDAPTERGARHLKELVQAREEGFGAYVMFVIQMKGIRHFEPNDATHPAFGATLRKAAAAGVKVLAYDCVTQPGSVRMDMPVKVRL